MLRMRSVILMIALGSALFGFRSLYAAIYPAPRPVRTTKAAVDALREWASHRPSARQDLGANEICAVHVMMLRNDYLVPVLIRDRNGRPQWHRWVCVEGATGKVFPSGVIGYSEGPPTGCGTTIAVAPAQSKNDGATLPHPG